jgi:hypothetical protein
VRSAIDVLFFISVIAYLKSLSGRFSAAISSARTSQTGLPSRRIGTDAKRVNVDFPAWMVDSLDREARRLGVTRQSLIKLWLADKLAQPNQASKR